MENLNAEQVKKGLERCANEWRCGLCGFTEKECALIKKSALALINKQETEYNELYELCESYRIERDAMRGAANSYKLHCKTLEKENESLKTLLDESYDTQNSLTEENERLRAENEIKTQKRANIFEIANAFERGRTDGVRKMQERLKSEIAKYFLPTFRFQANAFIDQIAKEMLESENER